MLKFNKSRAMIIALKQDLIRAQQSAKHWEVLANTDDLTGLHNRRMLHELDKKIGERRDPNNQKNISLLFIDLDNFGQLNKDFGDDVGDEALKLVGSTIRQNIREGDIAIRKGGDEFVIILMGSSTSATNDSIIKRLQMMLNGGLYLSHANISIPVRGSMGVFDYDEADTPFGNLKKADALMREQKQARKYQTSQISGPSDDGSLPV